MNYKTDRLRVAGIACIVLMVFAGLASGCTDDDTNTRPNPGNGGNGTTNDSDSDAGNDVDAPDDQDGDTGGDPQTCDEIECDEGEICEDGECIVEGSACSQPIEMDLSTEGTHTATADATDAPNLLNTDCGDEESPQAIFSFSVDTLSRLTTRIGDSQFVEPLSMEVRTQCDNSTLMEWCSVNEQTWIAEPETDYYVIVESAESDQPPQIGEFDLEMEVEHLVCTPGERSCEGGNVLRCAGGDEEVEEPCFGGCDGGECLGDTCSNPVTTTTGGTYQVDMGSFHNTIDFSDSPSCSSIGNDGPTTDGQDVVFLVEDVPENYVIEGSVPDASGEYRVGIMDECSAAPQCLDGNSTGGEASWQVGTAGDYYVVFNRATTSDESAEFVVDVID